MYRELLLIFTSLCGCLSLAEYELFPGFDAVDNSTQSTTATTATTIAATTTDATTVAATTTTATTTVPTTIAATTTAATTSAATTTTTATIIAHARGTTTTAAKPKRVKFQCPEEEQPANIGPYEVPTQRDLALLAKKTLKKMFSSYHHKAMYFLDDIDKATRATEQVAKKCSGNRESYKRCVQHVSTQCQTITKSFADSIEKMRNDVSAFSQNSICSITEMKADPVKLIKRLAMEEVALKFALPGFLRLLNACSGYCYSSTGNVTKILRQQVNKDPVIKKFLTRKTYNQVFMARKFRRYNAAKKLSKVIERIHRTERINNNR